MKKLPTAFRKEGFDLVQVKREGNVAIFKKTKAGMKYSCFEVVVVQSHNGYRFGDETFPPAEFMPKTEDWGSKAFTCVDIEQAEKKFEKLLQQQSLPKTPKTPKLKLSLKK